MHGQLYRQIGPMLPSGLPDDVPKCLQIYFCDPEYQAQLRASRFKSEKKKIATIEFEKSIFRKLHRRTTLPSTGPRDNHWTELGCSSSRVSSHMDCCTSGTLAAEIQTTSSSLPINASLNTWSKQEYSIPRKRTPATSSFLKYFTKTAMHINHCRNKSK